MQQFLVCGRDLNERVHIVIVLVCGVHLLLDVLSGVNRAAHLLIIGAGVVYITHTAAAPDGGVCDFRQYFLARTAKKGCRERNTVAHADQCRQPATAHKALIAVTGNVKVGVIHAVYHQIVAVRHVDRRRTDEIHHARCTV